MRKLFILAIVLVFSLTAQAQAQSPQGRDFGFGITLGDPTGITGKFWTGGVNAFAISVGSSYYGNIRLTGDYLWHFNAFNSKVVNLYAGPGLVLGFGHGNEWFYKRDDDKFWDRDDDIGVAGRAIFGINVVPRRTPLEFFLEVGVLVGVIPGFGTHGEAALGVRFYP